MFLIIPTKYWEVFLSFCPSKAGQFDSKIQVDKSAVENDQKTLQKKWETLALVNSKWCHKSAISKIALYCTHTHKVEIQ